MINDELFLLNKSIILSSKYLNMFLEQNLNYDDKGTRKSNLRQDVESTVP